METAYISTHWCTNRGNVANICKMEYYTAIENVKTLSFAAKTKWESKNWLRKMGENLTLSDL